MPPSLWPTQAEIDLSALWRNLRTARSLARPGTKICAVVKADGYGHGAVDVARALEGYGVECLAVAYAAEAVALRDAYIQTPVLVMGGPYREWASFYQHHNLTPALFDIDAARRMNAEAVSPMGVHLKVDTGMGRLGVPLADLPAFLDAWAPLEKLRIEGVFSHLACADDPKDELSAEQIRRFDEAVRVVREKGHAPSTLHLANSAGLVRYPESCYDMVRVGLLLYGAHSSEDLAERAPLTPVMRVWSEVALVKDLPAGATVGYGAEFTARRPTRVVAIPMGYADGFPRAASPGASVVLRGARAPVAGRVSMDLIVADLTDHPEAAAIRRGEPVEIFGQTGPASIRVEEFAGWAGTVAYEALTGVGARVNRRTA